MSAAVADGGLLSEEGRWRAFGRLAGALGTPGLGPAALAGLLAEATAAPAGSVALYAVTRQACRLLAHQGFLPGTLPPAVRLLEPAGALAHELRAALQLGRPLCLRAERLDLQLPPGCAGVALVPLATAGATAGVALVGLAHAQLRDAHHALLLKLCAERLAAYLLPGRARPGPPRGPAGAGGRRARTPGRRPLARTLPPEALLAGATDAFLRLDAGDRIVSANQAAADLLGSHDLVGAALWAVAPAVWSVLEPAVREAGGASGGTYLEFPNSEQRWLGLHLYTLAEGTVLLLADVSAHRRAAAAVQRAHRLLEDHVAARTARLASTQGLLEAMFDRAPAGIALTDVDGRILRANAALLQLFEAAAEDWQGTRLEQLAVPEERERLEAACAALREGGPATGELEIRCLRKNGSVLWCSLFLARLERSGQPDALLATMWDVTARKEAEQELLRSREELRTLFQDLQEVRAGERRALAREVHDHLGQILTALKIDLRLLAGDPRLGAALRPELDSATARIDQALEAVQDLARMLRPPELEAEGFAEALRWQLREFQGRTRIRCRFDWQRAGYRAPPPVLAHELFRIAQEALTNVLRHAGATAVVVTLRCAGGQVLLRVCDNGIGLGSGAADAGRGLGIRGMRERAHLAGGRLRMVGSPGRGCCVFVRVPLPPE